MIHNTRNLNMKKSILIAAGMITACHVRAETGFQDWFWMNETDGIHSYTTTSYTRENWAVPGSGTLSAAAAGGKYYVPEGFQLNSSYGNSPGRFAGDVLAVAGTIYCTCTGGVKLPFGELWMLPGSLFRHSSRNYMEAEKLVIKGSAEKPAVFQMYQQANINTIYYGTWEGDENAAFKIIHSSINNIPLETVKSQTVQFQADLSSYKGLMTVGQECNAVLLNKNAMSYPGVISVETNASLTTTLYSGEFTVGGLRFAAGADTTFYCEYKTGNFAPYNVTGSFETDGHLSVAFSGWPGKLYLRDNAEWTLFKLTGTAAETTADISDVKFTGLPKTGPLPRNPRLDYVTTSDGRNIVLKADPVVRMSTSNGSNGKDNLAFDEGNGSFWSTGSVPDEEFEGDVVIDENLALGLAAWANVSFPKMRITVDGGALYHQAAGLSVEELNLVAGSMVCTYNNASTPTLNGRIVLYPGDTPVRFTGWSNKRHVIAGELAGAGDLKLTVHDNAFTSNTGIDMELRGINTGFSGNISVVSKDGQYVEGTDGITDFCSTLYINDGRNLGGVYGGTNAWKALELAGHSRLHVLDDVTIDEPTRGVYINGSARMIVPDGLSLDIRENLTFGGVLTKLGGGMLTLGGAARFSDGGEPTDVPAGDGNALLVKEGSLRIMGTNAINGVAVNFAEGTELVVDPTAEGDLAEYGALCTGTGSALSCDGESIAVRLEEGLTPPETGDTPIAICTVPASAAASLKFSAPRRYAGRLVETSTRSNADGSVTFLVTVKHRKGLAVSFR